MSDTPMKSRPLIEAVSQKTRESMEEVHTEAAISVQKFDFGDSMLTDQLFTGKTVKYIERMARSSYEYKQYIDYLKNELDITKCSVLTTIDTKDTPVSLEFHHCPISMYDVCYTIGKYMTSQCSVSGFEIVEKVMREHYEGNIGLVPCTATAHQMAHNNAIVILPEMIYGNWQRFIAKYHNYMDTEVLGRINQWMAIDKDKARIQNAEKLKCSITDYNVTYNGNDPSFKPVSFPDTTDAVVKAAEGGSSDGSED